MRVAVTGTPGTGKTTATERLDAPVVHLNDAVREHDLVTDRDDDRESLVVDLEAAATFVDDRAAETDGPLVVESHLAHRPVFDADRVIVLRCRPDVVEERLLERGEGSESAAENRESEALDVVLGEAVAEHGRENVYELPATDSTPAETADEIAAVIAGERAPSAGDVDYLEYR